MLDLQAGVDLQEIKFARGLIVDEFDGACIPVAGRRTQPHRRFKEARALPRSQAGRGGFLDNLLVSALDGAITLAEGDDPAVTVTEDLHFDVPGLLDKFFQEDAALLEIVFGQPSHRGEGRRQFIRAANERHADPAATRRAF